jgi:hypothetical protein
MQARPLPRRQPVLSLPYPMLPQRLKRLPGQRTVTLYELTLDTTHSYQPTGNPERPPDQVAPDGRPRSTRAPSQSRSMPANQPRTAQAPKRTPAARHTAAMPDCTARMSDLNVKVSLTET